jgi:WD40-like Beta Propeller Repeat
MRSQGTIELRGSFSIFAKGLRFAWLPLLISCAHSSEPGTRSTGAGGTNSIITNPMDEGGLAFGGDGGIPGVPWQYAGTNGASAYKDPALPDNVKDLFKGPPSTSGQPVIVYPLTESMHAMNQGDITFQWNAGVTTSTLFKLEVTDGTKKFEFYLPCTNLGAAGIQNAKLGQCTYLMPELEWLDLGAQFRGKNLTFTIAGTDGSALADGGPAGVVYTSKPITITFSPEPVIGGLYYWAAASKSIKRFTFGAKKAVPFIKPNSPTDEFSCVACHSVSRDGKVIAFAVSQDPGGENTSAIQTAPTDQPDMPFVRPVKGMTPYYTGPGDLSNNNKVGPEDHFGHNVALSPDGSLAAINGLAPPPTTSGWPLTFEIRDTKSGMTLGATYPQGDPLFGDNKIPIFPEWSPDGLSIVATMSEFVQNNGCAFWTQSTCTGSIVTMSWTPTDPAHPEMGGTLGQAHTLVAYSAVAYHFYPSWSPDGKWIVFVSAPAGQGVSSLSNPKAVLRIVPSTGGPYTCPSSQCFDLVRGTQYKWADSLAGNSKHSTWPKFSPFAQGANQNLMFISFTSEIDYGYLAQKKPELWSFFIDTEKLVFGKGDPSYAPVWLPYQEINDGAISPYWTKTLPCTVDGANNCIGCVQGEDCEVDKVNATCHCTTARIQ